MPKKFLLKMILFYQRYISPIFSIYFNIHCRFFPSCSEYAKIAIKEWGIFKGTLLALKRFFRCHPLSKGGFDFPPTKKINRESHYG